MNNFLQKCFNQIYKKFKEDASGMLIWTGVAGWTLSALAQMGAILVNNKISDKQKSFLLPQEAMDAGVNILMFFLFTQSAKKLVSRMFKTGKWAPSKVKEFLKSKKELSEKIGKLDLNLDEYLKTHSEFPQKEYKSCKEFYTTLATVGAGAISLNVITPLARNKTASRVQKKYMDYKEKIKKQYPANNSGDMKI